MKKTIPFLLALLCLVLTSCKKNVNNTNPALPENEKSLTETDQLRMHFASTLARALINQQVRQLILDEAVKEFDNDNDVLFQLVKDKEINPGVTLSNYLFSLSGMPAEQWEAINRELPLLTILVPDLPEFSVSTWNVKNEIPVVAVVNSNFEEKKRVPLPGFDVNGYRLELPSDKAPDFPVIVVKENERMVRRPKNSGAGLADNSNLVFENGQDGFYFKDDSFNPEKSGPAHTLETAKFNVFVLDMKSQTLRSAYSQGAISQRDYIYYGILNANDSGVLDISCAEYLYGMTIHPNYEDEVYDDVTTDWSDGDMEIQLDVLANGGNGALDKVSKILSVERHDNLFSINPGYQQIAKFSPPVKLLTWDMQKYGNTLKYALHEIDPGSTMTITQTVSSKFGTNYSTNTTTGDTYKVGTEFGTTSEVSSTAQLAVQVTTGTDFLGEDLVNWVSPVVISRSPGPFVVYGIEEVSTGVARLLIMPYSTVKDKPRGS